MVGLSCLVSVTEASEEVYYWKDENGVFHYRNAPAPGWRNVEAFGLLEAEDAGIRRDSRKRSAPSRPVSLRFSTDRNRYDDLIEQISGDYEVEASLVKAVIHVESNFDPRAVSHRGACGLMQLMPRTARKHGIHDLMSPRENIRGGVLELRALLDRFGDRSLTWAIAAYNAGVYAVERHRGIPPYPETRRFVKKVLRLRRLYQRQAQLASR